MHIRLLALSQCEQHTGSQISRRSVNDWVRGFNLNGIDGSREKQRTGRPCALTKKQLEQLKDYVTKNSLKKIEFETNVLIVWR